MPDMLELRDHTHKLPNGRLLAEAGWQMAGFGVHRDSDPLAESNYAVALQRLIAAAGIDPIDLGYLSYPNFEDDAPIAVASFGHWAVGWVDELMVRCDRPDLLEICQDMLDDIDNYPVLDEDHFIQHEWERNHPEGECYCDDPECAMKPDDEED